jgi:hypothetical protein
MKSSGSKFFGGIGSTMTKRLIACALLLGLSAAGCGVDEIPAGLKKTPSCNGDGCSASVRFDLYHKPLPEIPLPNDSAMWPDPTSRTGLRVNASVIAPTEIEATARKKFDTLEGWGTYAPISVAFDKIDPDDPEAALDLHNLVARHQGDDYDLANDAIYVVNLNTGIPAVMDVGEGAFQYVIKEKHKYWRHDTRRLEQVLLWDTADETVDPLTGQHDAKRIGSYQPAWDTDFDGVIDRPNLLDQKACPTQVDVELVTDQAERNRLEVERDRCVADQLLTFYERETDTLILRPLVPLEEKTQYAVVITDRMLDAKGKPVRSPFDFVYHPAQEPGVSRLRDHLANAKLAPYYGDIGGKGLEHVVFAWTFTTQPVVEDLRVIRDGLYGRGPLAKLAKQFPAQAEAARAAGKITLEALAEDSTEPEGWESEAKCAGAVDKYYVIDFDVVKQTIKELAAQGFGFEGPTLDALVASFDAIDHVMVGTFKSPFFISGGPQGKDPNASFNMDFATGDGELHADTVQFMLTVPKQTETRKQPFPVAYYGHGYTSSSLESLGFAGSMAAQGIATVGMNATFHGLELGSAELQLARNLFAVACQAPFGSAMLQHRARDLDGDGQYDSGGDYWTSYLFHTRDVVRQSAVDLLQMFRIFKSFDGKNLSAQDLDRNGLLDDLAGDFDHDGVPDIGGPNVEFYAWGQSLGGILAPFVAALDPQVVAAAPTAGSGGLLDVGSRTFQGGAFEGIYLRNFGPLIVGVPVTELEAEKRPTTCAADQVSLRFQVLSVNRAAEVEINCIDKQPIAASGGTALVYNGGNGVVRCARIDKEGRFRIGIPSSLGDRLEVQIYDQPDVVDTYDGESGCNISVGEEHRVALIQSWGKGLVPSGTLRDDGTEVCTNANGCSQFQDKYFPHGSELRAIAEGFGHIRQTPALRRFMSLASHIIDPGDPINFAPYYALRPIDDPFGNPHPSTGVLNVVTIGDMNVPLSSGIALGRAAGAVPFLTPSAAEQYPALADYATPALLYTSLGNKTPHRVMIENHVMEGINRLERHPPPAGTCQRNIVPFTPSDTTCYPTCENRSDCIEDQECEAGRCVSTAVAGGQCKQYLYDIDVLDEGTALYGEQEASVPLRLARIAKPTTPDGINEVWAPRLDGKPFGSDAGAWAANQRVVGQLQAYVNPRGDHGFEPSTPCENWDRGQYMINLIGRFFATSGTDVYYLSHPASHLCLGKRYGKGVCSFVFIPPP